MFAVGTEQDHVAPWHSVYKLHLLTDTDVTFLLTSGGHNAGIVSPPGTRQSALSRDEPVRRTGTISTPTSGPREAPRHDGSWWQAWSGWLDANSGAPVAPPSMGAAAGYPPLGDAPGTVRAATMSR